MLHRAGMPRLLHVIATFRYASASEADINRVEDPTKAAANLNAISEKDARGCVWGLITSWFKEAYDDVTVINGREYPYLVDVCSNYIETDSASPKGWLACIGAAMESLAYRSDRHQPRKMIDAFCGYFKMYISSTTMEQPRSNRWANRTYALCAQSALETNDRISSREYRARMHGLGSHPCAAHSDMCVHGWRSDVLE